MAIILCYRKIRKMKVLLFVIPILVLHGACTNNISLPEPVTNNAVAALQKNNKTYLYSFFGLDSTKRWYGVHNKVYRVDLENKTSSLLGNVPDEYGRLASATSVIRNKAYIAGGYAVLENGKEKSSNHIFIFDPDSEQFSEMWLREEAIHGM